MAERKDQCRYCGSTAHGYGCPYGEEKIHIEVGDSEHCIFCGSTNYGKGCIYNNGRLFKRAPQGLHMHGHGQRKCIWCGKVGAYGKGCPYSPTGNHSL